MLEVLLVVKSHFLQGYEDQTASELKLSANRREGNPTALREGSFKMTT